MDLRVNSTESDTQKIGEGGAAIEQLKTVVMLQELPEGESQEELQKLRELDSKDEKQPGETEMEEYEENKGDDEDEEFNMNGEDVEFDKNLPWKVKIFETFDNPKFSKLAQVINIYVLLLIVLSTITFCLQSIPSLSSTPEQDYIWYVLEIFVVANFTAEYVIRLFTCPNVLKFVIAPLNVIDLVAILPFYISLIIGNDGLSGLAVARVLRLVRIFRILKLGKTVDIINMIGTAFYRSRQGILVLLFMVCLAMIFFASFAFYAETSICELRDGVYIYTSGQSAGEETCYQNIIASFWWALVTLTTVGYGDCFPVSSPGKAVGAVTMVSGVLVLAFPITIIGVHLTDTYSEFREEKKSRKRKEKAMEKAKTIKSKDVAKLVKMLGTHQQALSDLSSTVADKITELNEIMGVLLNEQRNLDVLAECLKSVTEKKNNSEGQANANNKPQ